MQQFHFASQCDGYTRLVTILYSDVKLHAVDLSPKTEVAVELHDFLNRHHLRVSAPYKTVANAYKLPFHFLFLL